MLPQGGLDALNNAMESYFGILTFVPDHTALSHSENYLKTRSEQIAQQDIGIGPEAFLNLTERRKHGHDLVSTSHCYVLGELKTASCVPYNF